ncbi:MAG: hypothetical protein AAGI44_18290, partial [Pseudomonadota bacterium]
MSREPTLMHRLCEMAGQAYLHHTVRVSEVEALVDPNFSIDGVDHQLVVFRGTETKLISEGGWVDVLRDLRAYPWRDSRIGWAHTGFLKGARGVVDKGLFGVLRKDQPIAMTGHSKGGAIALPAAAILNEEGFSVNLVVTFGSPRVFTRGSVKR